MKNSPKWQRLNRIDEKSKAVALDFIKFSDQLIRIKNAVDATLVEIEEDRDFNHFNTFRNIIEKRKSPAK